MALRCDGPVRPGGAAGDPLTVRDTAPAKGEGAPRPTARELHVPADGRRHAGASPRELAAAGRGALAGEPLEGLVCGRNAVRELLCAGAPVEVVWAADTLPEPVAGYYAALAREAGAVFKRVRAARLRAMCGSEAHQGVACRAGAVAYVQPADLLAAAAAAGVPPLLVLADGVEDPHNLGAILRTALLCGAHGVILPRRGASGITPAVLRASAGAAARLPVARVANIRQTVRWLKAQGVFVYCAQAGGAPPYRQDLTGPLALVLGSEGAGVSPLVQRLCDGVVSLPMAPGAGGVDSFNVSVAAGMLLYEIGRQRALAAPKAP